MFRVEKFKTGIQKPSNKLKNATSKLKILNFPISFISGNVRNNHDTGIKVLKLKNWQH